MMNMQHMNLEKMKYTKIMDTKYMNKDNLIKELSNLSEALYDGSCVVDIILSIEENGK